MGYIRQDQLSKLKEYKYSGVDHSLVSRYVLKPFYTKVAINFIPWTMAPNAVTLTGFAAIVVNFFTLLWYNPTLDQDCPLWVYVSWAAGLFFYQTMDALDGTQARRTKQSGPLGELFDHGVDAVNTSLEVLLFAGATNLGQGWKTVLTLFASLLTFYVQTWDEYHTHTLTLGLVSGPVEGILTLVLVYALTAVVGGGSFWQQPMLASLGISQRPSLGYWIPDLFYNLAWNEWYMVYGGLVLIYNTTASALTVISHRRRSNLDPLPALLDLTPFFTAWLLIPLYLSLNPIILHHHLAPFVFYAGLVNAHSVGRIIIGHLTKSSFPTSYTNVLLLPLIFGVLDSLVARYGAWVGEAVLGERGRTLGGYEGRGILGEEYQVPFVFFCLGCAVGVYGSFAVDVIVSICDYLDIWCLTIKYPKVDKNGNDIVDGVVVGAVDGVVMEGKKVN